MTQIPTKPDPSVSKAEMRKLYIMMIISILFLGMILINFQYGWKRKKKAPLVPPPKKLPISITHGKVKKNGSSGKIPVLSKPDKINVAITDPPKEPFRRNLSFEKAIRDQTVFETPEVYYFLHWINGMSQKEILAKKPPRIRFFKFWKKPQKHRGKFYHLIGTLRDIHTYAMKNQNHPSNVQVVYRGILSDKHTQPFFFVFIDKKKDFTPNESTVQIYGVFVKNFKYQAANGKILAMPLIIGRTLTGYKNIKVSELPFNKVAYGVVAVGLATLLLSIVLALFYQKRDKAFEEVRRQRQLERYKKKHQDNPLKAPPQKNLLKKKSAPDKEKPSEVPKPPPASPAKPSPAPAVPPADDPSPEPTSKADDPSPEPPSDAEKKTPENKGEARESD